MGRILFLCFLSLLLTFSTAYGENDAPHNSSNNIACDSCHDESLASSPFWSANPDDDTYNNFCLLNCHDANFGPYSDTSALAVLPHNSTTTSTTYGTWSVSCVECHDPHNQHQISYKNSDSSAYYIASGATTTPNPIYDSGNNTSTVYYSSLNYKSGWDANSLVVKSGDYRRPIMFINTKKTGYNYTVKEIDNPAGTITVEGNATQAFLFINPPTNFTITYGQLLRTSIDVGGTDTAVKFFDKEGVNSFAYDESSSGTDPSPNGICQVCHENTTHWNKDGSGAATGVHSGLNGFNCMLCHPHADGFAPSFPDHEGLGYIVDSAHCVSCHNGTEPVADIHNSNCGYCHQGDMSLQGGLSQGDCANCHTAYDTSFETGHQNEDHTLLTATSNATPTLNCGGCHSGNIITDAIIHNSFCNDCHTDKTSDGTLTSGTLGDATGHTVGQASECVDCHASNYFASHTHSHTVSIGASDLSQTIGEACSTCHDDNGGSLASWNDIFVEHLSDCTTCHDATRDTSKSGTYSIGATVQTVIAANTNPTNCLACHRDKADSIAGNDAYHGIDHKVEGKVTGAAQCIGCHDQSNIDDDSHFILTLHNASGCATCHVATSGAGPLKDYSGSGGTIGDFVNYETINLGAGGSCADCHAAYASNFASGHKNESHAELATSANCTTTCHSGGDLVADVHSSTCTACHTNTTTDGRLRNATNGDASGHTIGGSSTCANCHSDYNTNFQTGHDVKDHTGITTSANCATSCHTANTAATIVSATHSNTCTLCHTNTSSDGSLRAGASSNGDASSGAGACADCHAAYNTNFSSHDVGDHSGVIANPAPVGYRDNCVNCHTGDLITAVAAGSNPGTHQNTCSTCHVNTAADGTLKDGANNYGDASGHVVGSSSDCDDCHSGDGYFDAHTHTHTIAEQAADISQENGIACSSCHDDNGGGLTTWTDILVEHLNLCTTCHDSNRDTSASTTYTIGSTIQDIIAANGNPTSCGDCHRDKIDSISADAMHGVDHIGLGKVTGSAQCTGCHDQAAENSNLFFLNTIHTNCGKCHVAAIGMGPLHDYQGSGGSINEFVNYETLNGGAGGSCADCHASYASNFETGHKNEDHDTLSGSANCATTCHDGNLITSTHANTCTDCHTNTSTDGRLKVGAAANGDATAHTVGVASDCADCHAAYDTDFTAHDVADHSGIIANQTPANNREDCVTCHTGNLISAAAAGSDPGTHQNDCTLCHTNTSTNGTLVDGSRNYGDASGHSIATPSDCNDCHAADGYFDTHFHSHTVALGAGDLSWEVGTACSGCHDDNGGALASWTDIYVEHLSSCGTCHDASRDTSKSGTYTIAETVPDMVAANADPTNCSACHRDKIDSISADASHGIDHKADGRVTGSAQCTGCHDQAGNDSNDQYLTTVHGACGTCHVKAGGGGALHDYSGSGGSIAENVNYETLNAGAGGTCVDCHASYAANFASGHKNESHAELSTAANCTTTCHSGDMVSSVHASNCTDCHTNTTSDGRLRVGASANGDATGHTVGGSSDCTDCHAAYNTNFQTAHDVVDHSGVTTSVSCTTSCHTANTGATIISATHQDTCTNCHTNLTSDGTLIAATDGDASGGAGDCASCHAAYATNFQTGHNAADHSGVGASANCTTTCHSGAIASALHTGCTKCHTNMVNNGTLKNATNGDGSGHVVGATSTCASCHTAYNSNFQTAHDVKDHTGIAVSANCTTSCHTANTASTIVSTTHGDTCTLCHTNTTSDGTLLVATNGDASRGTGNCADCHADYNTNFLTAHDVVDHSGVIANAAPVGYRDDCVNCHTGNRITAVAGGSNPGTHQNDCANCHTNTTSDGTLKDGANNYGDASGHVAGSSSDCDACHSGDGYFGAHTHVHTVSQGAGDISQELGLNCSSCHDDNGGALASWADILVEHLNSCGTCHEAVRDTSASGSYSIGESVQDMIAANTDPTNCAACHRDQIDTISLDATHGIDHLAQGRVSGSDQCTGCHDQSGNDNNIHYLNTIHTTCGACHVAASGGGPLHDYSGSGGSIAEFINYETLNGGVGGACVDCHAAYGANFASGHKNESHAELNTAANCTTTCHSGDIITSVHGSSCTDCHTNTTTDGRLRLGATLNGDATNHVIGGSSACTDCHAAYNTNFQNAHDIKDHTGVAVSANCTTTCHTANSAATIISDTHGDSCTLCHTNLTSDGSLLNATNGDASGGTGACAVCHADYNTNFQTAHDVKDHDGLATSASCTTSCHSGAIPSVVHSVCTACHTDIAANGTLKSATNGDASGHVIGVSSECADCHGDYSTNFETAHDVKDHTGITTSTNCATTCHTANTAPTIVSDTHGDTCTLCHTNATTNGSLKSATNGDATGGAGDCASCHSAYNTNFQTAHDVADHSGMIANQAPANNREDCANCHTGNLITAVAAGSNPGTHQNDCANCHNNLTTDGSLVDGANNYGDATSHILVAPSDCDNCHAADGYFDAHTHTHLISEQATDVSQEANKLCSVCHDDNGGGLATWTDIYVEHLSSCATCHDTSRDTSKSGTYSIGETVWDIISANTNPTACAACHRDKIDSIAADATHGIDHKGQGRVIGATECAGCHDPSGNDDNDQYLNTIHGTCGKCHVDITGAGPLHDYSGTGGTIGALVNYEAINAGAGGACTDCHGATFEAQHSAVDHSTFVSMATECSGCHTATGNTINPADNQVHDSCAACHGTTGVLVGSAAGKTNGGDCTTCHSSFGDTAHQNTDHSAYVSMATDCTLCHSGAEGTGTGMEVDPANDKKHDTCATCHGATGVLVGSATDNTGSNDCEGCHGAYFPSHQNPDTLHDNRSIDFGALGHVCSNCHTSDTTLGLGVPGSGGLTTMANVDDMHARSGDPCLLCHYYDAASQSNGEGLPLESTVTNAIVNGMAATTDATCVVCHDYNEDPALHGGHLVPDNITTKLAACVVCHDRDLDAGYPKEVIFDIHNNDCSNCHATPAPPTLLNPATKPYVTDIVRGDCGDCHSVNYDHANDSHAKIIYGDDVANGNANCTSCHNADVIVEHTTVRGWQCAVCHSNPCYDTIINNAINNITPTVFCTDCHTNRDFPHGMIDHEGVGVVSEELYCSVCHDPNNDLDLLVDIHGNGADSTCGLCHVNPAGAGALIAVLEGDGDAVDGGTCSSCHNSSLAMPNIGAFHGMAATDSELQNRHNNLAGATGVAAASTNNKIIAAKTTYACDDCHNARNAQERLESHGGCITCHNGITDYEAVITAGMASGGNTAQDCEACHNNTINGGGATNSPTGKAMEQYDGLRHHALEYAQAGRCDYCHADPRPDWGSTYGATLPSPLPSQMACITCHMDTSANGVVVKKNTYDPTSVYYATATAYNLSTVSSVQQSTMHTITGVSPIAVTNYGACLGCHSVNIWHAKPEWNKDTHDTSSSNKDDAFDVLRNAPGRSIWPSQPNSSDNDPTDNGGIAKFDIFSTGANTGGATKVRMYGRYNFGSSNKPYEKTGSENRGDKLYKTFKNTNPWINTLANAPLGFTRETIPQIDAVNDAEGQMTSDPMVPVFAAISEPAVTGQDKIEIVDGGWNADGNEKLQVIAANRYDNTVNLTISFGSQITNAAMTWDGSLGAWTYTSAAAVTYDGSTITVTSDHAGGGNDTAQARNMTVIASEVGSGSTVQEHIDNAAANIPATVLAAGACTDCHDGNLAVEHANRGRSCSVCHTPCETPPTPLSSVDCNTCHAVRPADHPADITPEHYFLERNPATCVSCHDDTNVETGIHTACSSCHDSTFNVNNMQGGANSDASLHVLGTNSWCTVCHPNHGTDFTAGHLNEDHANVTGTGSSQCTSCHSGADEIVDVHGNDCTLCHTDGATDGSLIGSAADHTINSASACVDCHPAHAANFETGHQNEDHANVIATVSATPVENCAACHPGNVITDAALHDNTCSKCHTNTVANGSLRAGAVGDATSHVINTQSGCADCHSAYFNGHGHVHTIIVYAPGSDVGQADSQPCSNCHDDNGGSLATWADILIEHRSDCGLCHNATRTTGNPSAPGETVQDIITAKNNPTNCLDCHWDKKAPATHDIDHPLQGRVTGVSQCTSCHDKDNVGSNAQYIDVIHDMGANGCGLCHVDTNGGGPLVAPYETNFPNGGSCADCHAAYATNFGTGHTSADHSGLSSTATCTGCHDGDIIHGANTHNSSCTRCHTNTVSDGTLRVGTTGTAASHYLGTDSDCADCHSSYATDFENTHTVSDHSGITTTDSCQSCHTGDSITATYTHNSGCGLCHTNTSDNGSLKAATNGDATNHSLSSDSTCLTCHVDYTPDFASAGAHKVKDHSGLIDSTGGTPTTNCVSCHDGIDDRPIVDWNDDFTGLTTGAAGRSTFGNWTGVNGSDGTNPWMAWSGSTDTGSTGPSNGAGGSGNYLVLESSATTPATSTVTRLGNWSTNQANTTGNATLDYTMPAGSNRVLVVTVSAEDSGQVNITGANYGGSALSQVTSAVQGTGFSNETWIGICDETCIAAASGTIISATFTGSHSTGMTIGAATFANVDQATPVSDFASLNNTTNTISVSVTNPANGKVVYMVEFNGVGGNSISPPSGFSEIAEFDTTGSGFRSEIGERTSTAGGSVTVNPTNTGVSSGRTTIVALALNPSTGDQDATNGVNLVANSTHYLESSVIDASAASVTFSFKWNMNVSDNVDASLHVDAYNGAGWDADVTGGAVQTGNNGDTWIETANIDLSAYTNANFQIRIRYEVGTGTTYLNDLGLDDLIVIGTPRDLTPGDVHYDDCTLCHSGTGSGELQTGSRGDAAGHTLGVDSECSSCHGAFGYFDSHLHGHDVRQGSSDLSQSASQACSSCHGIVTMWSSVLTLHTSTCTMCHDETRDINPGSPTGTTVQDVISDHVGTVNCLDCHADKASPADHGVIDHFGLGNVTWTAKCATCHNASGNEDVIYDVHKVGTKNMCGVCHENPYGVGPLLEPWETDSPTGGECTTCHGSVVTDQHHAREQAQGGDCTYCHVDPRPDWVSTYGTFTPSPMAKQLACVECHVEPTGTGLTVYRNTYNPTAVSGFPSGNTSLAISGGTRVQQSAVHTIVGASKINVYDYGACLGCHDGNTVGAPQIQVWHAKPIWNKDSHDVSTNLYDDPFDALRYAPGRSEINNSGSVIDSKFNLFYNGANTGTSKVRMYGRYNFGQSGKPYKSTNSESRGKNLYDTYKNDGSNPWFNDIYSQRFQIPCVAAVNDAQSICNGTNPWVPYYNDIAAPQVYDNVLITTAEWDGTDLNVKAYNDYQNGMTLTFDYGGTTGNAMTWNATTGRWEATLTSAYFTTVTVNSSSAGGGTDTATVTDLTATPDILFVTKSEWDSANGGTLTIWAEHSVNNGSLTYEVTYGHYDLGAMTWNGVERQYELSITGIQYFGIDTLANIASSDPGGDSVDVPVTDASGPPEDVIYITTANWDGNNGDVLTIYATHKLNSGVLTYKVDYNGYNGNVMTWKSSRFRYELLLPGVTFNGAAQAYIYSDDAGGDNATAEVTDISGTVDHEGLGHVTQTAECSKCHNWNANDPQDVVSDIHNGKCTLCHTTWPALKGGITAGNCEHCHAADYHPYATLHDQITYGYGGNSCLMSCHKPVPLDEHLTGAVTGRTWECTSCHASPYYIGIINAAVAGTYDVYCTDCHANQTFPHGVRHHDITNLANCSVCHSDVDVVSVIHKANCAACHESVDAGVVNTIAAGGGDCADCHASEYQHVSVGWHNNSILESCNVCHDAATFDEIVNTHRDSCASCHESQDATVISVIDTGGAVSCDFCHTWNAADRHHLNTNAQEGNCEYCHADPRPDWATTYSETLPSPLPKQLACVKCHIESGGTGLVVYSNTYTPVSVSSRPNGLLNWGVSGDASVQQSAIHTISGAAKIEPYNYGICLSCHDEDLTDNAPAVQIWHAKPTWDKTTNDTSNSVNDNLFDVLRNAPGRSYYANNNTPPVSSSDAGADDQRFNIFATGSNTGGVSKLRTYGRYHFGDSGKPYKNTSTDSEDRGKDFFDNYKSTNPWIGSVFSQRITIPQIDAVNDPEGLMSSDPQVPYYTDITAPVVNVADDVTITMAQWYETDHDLNTGELILQAVNRETDTLQYNAGNMNAVGSHWEITLTGVANPGTVTVTSTYTNGGDDNATVLDMTCYTCIQDNTIAHDYIENLVDPSCAECHNASLVDEHAVHGLSCSNCHESTDPVVMQAIEVGVYGGVTCETCHGARSAEHPYDLHTHTVHQDATDLAQTDSQPCTNCHLASTWDEIEGTLHNVADNGPGSCNTCHLSNRQEVVDIIKYRVGGEAHCLDCHSLMTAPAAHGNDHLVSLGAGDLSMSDSQPCSNCHGALADWSDIYVVHLSNCDTCHTATRDINPGAPTGTTVADVIAALNPVECLGCHDDKAATADHGLSHIHIVPGVRDSAYYGTLTCFTGGCHAQDTYQEHMQPGGIAYQKFEDAANSFQCDWCHQYKPTQPGMTFNDDPVINNAISIGVDSASDVYCSDCHAYSVQRIDPHGLGVAAKYSDPDFRISTEHHANSNEALTGDCTHCHTDLRTDPYGTAESLPTPKKMACIACHVDADPVGGSFGTGQMTVYKAKTATMVDHGSYYSWDWQFTGNIANTVPADQSGMPHQWNVVGGMIDNFGVCLFCHRFGPYHAKPASAPGDDADKDVVDLFNDPPYLQNVGRGLIGAHFPSHRKTLNYYNGFAQNANQTEYQEIRDSESWARDNILWAKVTYDPQSDRMNNVDPDHTMFTPEDFIVPTFDTAAGGDNVTITVATFNSGTLDLDVTATNTSTGMGYELYAVHNGQSVLMTESPAGTWNGTISGYPNDVSDEPGAVYVISIDPSSNDVTLAQDATNPTPVVNTSPSITVTSPTGGGVTRTQGNSYNITYNLSDSEDTVTAAFYYDTDNTGLNGTAISGCGSEPEATGGTCTWNTTSVTPGTYYIYAVSSDGSNPQVSDYSSGTVTIVSPSVTVGGGVSGTYQSSTESWQMALYDLNNPFTAAASGTVVDFTVNVTNPGNFTLFVCAPTGGEGGTCDVNATHNVSTANTGNVTWSGLSMPISNGEVIGIWHAAGDGIGEKTTVGFREQYQLNAAAPTASSTINGSNYGVSLMMEATVEY